MNKQYKPCPFCGSTNVTKVLMPGFTWIVGCNECGCRTSEHLRSIDAENSWNNRVEPEKVCQCGQCKRDPEDEIRSVAEIINEMAEQGNMPTLCEETPF